MNFKQRPSRRPPSETDSDSRAHESPSRWDSLKGRARFIHPSRDPEASSPVSAAAAGDVPPHAARPSLAGAGCREGGPGCGLGLGWLPWTAGQAGQVAPRRISSPASRRGLRVGRPSHRQLARVGRSSVMEALSSRRCFNMPTHCNSDMSTACDQDSR